MYILVRPVFVYYITCACNAYKVQRKEISLFVQCPIMNARIFVQPTRGIATRTTVEKQPNQLISIPLNGISFGPPQLGVVYDTKLAVLRRCMCVCVCANGSDGFVHVAVWTAIVHTQAHTYTRADCVFRQTHLRLCGFVCYASFFCMSPSSVRICVCCRHLP